MKKLYQKDRVILHYHIKLLLTVFLLLSGVTSAMAKHTISGVVKDGSTGEALPGVIVMNKSNNMQYATTDNNGRFSITAPKGSVLEFSFMGYNKKEVNVGDNTSLSIVLDVNNQLIDELVVVGFAQQKKVNLTGSVSTLSSKELESVPVSNAILALQGQVPGLNIYQNSGQLYGKTPSIDIRGLATIGDGSSGGALVLIDGMEGDLRTLNPQDIENISVLKDAAASSIYGSRAPFGVILVTTKKGEKGSAKVNYNNSFRFNTPIVMPKMADSYSWALFFNDCARNDGSGDDIGPERLKRIKDYMDGKISYNTIPVGNQWGTAYTEGNDNIDYYDVFYKDITSSMEHNVSISGASDRINYFVSGNYLKENGQLNWDLDGLSRYNMFGKVEGKPYDFLTINYSSRVISEDYFQPRVLDDDRFQRFGEWLWPVGPLYDPNGIMFNDNVLQFTQGGQMKISNRNFTQQFSTTLEPLEGWRVIGDFNYRYTSYFNHINTKTVSQTCVDGITPGSTWDDSSSATEDAGRTQFVNANIYSDYEHTVANDHHFKIMVGFQTEIYKYKNIYAHKVGLIVPDLPSLDTSSGLFKGEQVPPHVAGGYHNWQTAGFFGRFNYNYKEIYLLEANARYDGSSRFRRDNRWGFFPSVSLGYNIANESYFSSAKKYVDMLKVRASYGSLGNQNTTSYYPTYSAMGFANSAGGWLIGGQRPNIAWPASLISSSLTWEEIRSWNAGLDFAMFNNRFRGSFDYFVRHTLNMVGPADELPVILGTAVPKSNNTNLKTTGFELELSWRDRLFNSINYGIRFILSDSQSEITKYSNPSRTLLKYYEGMKWGEIWGYTSVGIARNQEQMLRHLSSLPNGGQSQIGSDWRAGDVMYKDVNGDGKISSGANTVEDHGDLSVIGNTTPRYNYAFDITTEWKGIDLRVFLQGVGSRDFYQGGKYFFGAAGGSKWGTMALDQHMDYFRDDPKSPKGVNIESYYPRPYFGSDKNVQTQTMYLQNASYLRVKNIQVGYTLPISFTRRFGVSNFRLYFSGENLFTFTSMTDLFDPETIGKNSQGNVYPLTKTYSLGASITF